MNKLFILTVPIILFSSLALADNIKISDTQYQITPTSTPVVIDMDIETAAISQEQSQMDYQDSEAKRISDYYAGIHADHENKIAEHQKNIDSGISLGATTTAQLIDAKNIKENADAKAANPVMGN